MRRAGILLHPTSLPGAYGVGDIGPAARQFVSFLASASQSIWQMLPLNPADGHGSPYTSPSAFARHPLLISPDELVSDGWLRHTELPVVGGDVGRVDFQRVQQAKAPALALAAERVMAQIDLDEWASRSPWREDWCLYAALMEVHGPVWTDWTADVRDRVPAALDRERDRVADRFRHHAALQWLFEQQWARLRQHARTCGVSLWGDMPYFVGALSCDAWANRDLFRLDEGGKPTVITGVPPDAFSPLGQLWGHAHYAEAAHAAQDFQWWGDRLGALLELVDEVRIDHFRGVQAVWEVAVDATDAREGRWIPGPGAPMLQALKNRFGDLPLIAEDLGIITPEVEAIRDGFDLPGMVILQFAFGAWPMEPNHPYLPHSHRPRQVVYPGTHDNDTVVGWWQSTDDRTRRHVQRYLTIDGRDIAWDMMRCAYHSVARDAVVCMQDILGLDTRARMNVPGTAQGNWGWRMPAAAMNPDLAAALAQEVLLAGRAPLRREA